MGHWVSRYSGIESERARESGTGKAGRPDKAASSAKWVPTPLLALPGVSDPITFWPRIRQNGVDHTAGKRLRVRVPDINIVDIVTIIANLGVIAGLWFLAVEVRQNNRFLAAQARYSLRQYRAAMIDSYITPHVNEALHKYASGQATTPSERSIALMTALNCLELWEWQWGEYAAGMLQRQELPVLNWRIWYHGHGVVPCPLKEVWPKRRPALNPEFVRFFEENVTGFDPGAGADGYDAKGDA